MKNMTNQNTSQMVDKIVTAIAQHMDKSGLSMSDTLYNALLDDMSDCIEEAKKCGDTDLTEYVKQYYETLSTAIAAVDFEQVVNEDK
mgnify:CR=1 FL=1